MNVLKHGRQYTIVQTGCFETFTTQAVQSVQVTMVSKRLELVMATRSFLNAFSMSTQKVRRRTK